MLSLLFGSGEIRSLALLRHTAGRAGCFPL